MHQALNRIKQHSPFVFVYAHGGLNCSCQAYLFFRIAHACSLFNASYTVWSWGEYLWLLCKPGNLALVIEMFGYVQAVRSRPRDFELSVV